jgi:hypothetical protein
LRNRIKSGTIEEKLGRDADEKEQAMYTVRSNGEEFVCCAVCAAMFVSTPAIIDEADDNGYADDPVTGAVVEINFYDDVCQVGDCSPDNYSI